VDDDCDNVIDGPAAAAACDDGDACTTDARDGSGQCVHVPIADCGTTTTTTIPPPTTTTAPPTTTTSSTTTTTTSSTTTTTHASTTTTSSTTSTSVPTTTTTSSTTTTTSSPHTRTTSTTLLVVTSTTQPATTTSSTTTTTGAPSNTTTSSTTTTTLPGDATAEDACAPAPPAGCLATAPGKATLRLRNVRRDARDRLTWEWTSDSLVAGDLGADPTAGDYLMCVYADGALVLRARAPGDASCAGKPCWKATPRRFRYRNKELTPDGVGTIMLRPGQDGRIIVKGKGANLAMPELPLAVPVAVQLRRTDGGPCWESTIDTPLINTTRRFRGRSR
jgi:hypothetical protein